MTFAIVSALVEVGKWLADKAVTIGLVIYHATRIVGIGLFRFGHAVAVVFGKVWGAFTKFYAAVLKPFVEWAWKSIVKFHAWLKDTFGPLLKFLEALRKDILDVYNKWLKPIFDTIDTTRSVLRLLADFHVPFAAKLDDALARLEARLMEPIQRALTEINKLIYWIDRIVDFNGLFQRLTFIATAIQYEHDMWRVWWTSVSRREIERPKAPGGNTTPPLSPTQASNRARLYIVNHEGDDVARIDEHAQDLRLRLKRAA